MRRILTSRPLRALYFLSILNVMKMAERKLVANVYVIRDMKDLIVQDVLQVMIIMVMISPYVIKL